MLLRESTLCLLLALAAPILAYAENRPQPVPTDGKCSVQADPTWTKQEQFVWRSACLGKEVNFNKEPGYGGDLDPKGEAGLPDSRILRSSFLETILLKDKYRSALTRFGVRITGARFTETVDLENADLQHEVWLDRSLLEKGVDVMGMKTSRRLTFDESKIVGQIDAFEVQLDADLSMEGAELVGGIDLTRAHVGNGVNLEGAKIVGLLNMNTTDIGHNLLMDGEAQFKEIDLTAAHIGGQLSLRTSTVSDKLVMSGIAVDRELFADDAKFNEIDLSGGHVAGSLSLSGTKINGALSLNTIDVRQNLLLNNGARFKNVDLVAAHIGGQLNLHAATVTEKLDMNGIVVNQDLHADRANFNEIDLGNAHVASLTLRGAEVDGALNMNAINVRESLSMGEDAQFKSIDLVGAHIGGQLNLRTATVANKLGMSGIVVDQDLFADAAKFSEIDLDGGHVASLSLDGAQVTGMLNMGGLHTDQDLMMSGKAHFADIFLVGAHIGRALSLGSSTVTGKLNMSGARIDQNLIMNNGAQFDEVSLIAAHVARQFNLKSATFAGKFVGDYLAVDHTVFFGDDAEFKDEIELASARLGQDLYLSGGKFHKRFNLTSAQIVGALGLDETKWFDEATLDLTDASAGGIDLSDNWPDKMLLNGFAYRSLFNIPKNISKQAEDWFKKQTYAPQPYEQLASVLQANGLADDAIDVRFAAKDAELRAASGWRRIGLFTLKWSIGFGYRLQEAFAWALCFVLLGWVVLCATGQRTKHGRTLGLVYSFDMLLPLVQLSKKHDEIELDTWPRRYFYVHKLIGVILASFIVAGISGLTK